MKAQKLTLYNVEWQSLRVSLLGSWNDSKGVESNIIKLLCYLHGDINISKLWRALNLLNAVRMGYNGQGLINSEMDNLVKTFRDAIQALYRQAQNDGHEFEVDSADQIRKDWKQLSSIERILIHDNLSARLEAHKESKHREELRWFLGIIQGG